MQTTQTYLTKEEALIRFRTDQWALVNRYQGRVMPLLYGVGSVLEINEIDIYPRREVVVVYTDFKGRNMTFEFDVTYEPYFDGDLEIKFERLSEKVPTAILDELPKFEETHGLHLFTWKDHLMLRMRFSKIKTPEELYRILESLEHYRKKIELALQDKTLGKEQKIGIVSKVEQTETLLRVLN